MSLFFVICLHVLSLTSLLKAFLCLLKNFFFSDPLFFYLGLRLSVDDGNGRYNLITTR